MSKIRSYRMLDYIICILHILKILESTEGIKILTC